MKPTEKRLLWILRNTPLDKHYAAWLAIKLNILAQNITPHLKSMTNKNWLTCYKAQDGKIFYRINEGYAPEITAEEAEKEKEKQLMLTQ